MYEVDGLTVLHSGSGRNLPGPSNVLQHGEEVAVVLDPVMTQAWCDAEDHVNSRIVSVCLQLDNKNNK